VLRLL